MFSSEDHLHTRAGWCVPKGNHLPAEFSPRDCALLDIVALLSIVSLSLLVLERGDFGKEADPPQDSNSHM